MAETKLQRANGIVRNMKSANQHAMQALLQAKSEQSRLRELVLSLSSETRAAVRQAQQSLSSAIYKQQQHYIVLLQKQQQAASSDAEEATHRVVSRMEQELDIVKKSAARDRDSRAAAEAEYRRLEEQHTLLKASVQQHQSSISALQASSDKVLSCSASRVV